MHIYYIILYIKTKMHLGLILFTIAISHNSLVWEGEDYFFGHVLNWKTENQDIQTPNNLYNIQRNELMC